PQPLIGVGVTISPQGLTGSTGQNGVLFTSLPPLTYVDISLTFPGTCGNLISTTFTVFLVRGLVPITHREYCSGSGAVSGTIVTALGNPLANIRVSVGPYTLTTDANGHWGVGGLPPGPVQVLRLDTPAGCGGSSPLVVAVIPMITLAVNETVTCSGF
ncbi:MAG: carboxypeptidase-like regulatory domain-containing protein, partial [Gemmatimonadota bacterium]|nr:carboxypeptidase-like regulatory domain-containing protein [Gemmatimonadota bacterium]